MSKLVNKSKIVTAEPGHTGLMTEKKADISSS